MPNRPALTALLLLVFASALLADDKKVKVFILAGQSNMEGKGFPEPLAYQVSRPEYRDRYTHFLEDGDHEAFARKHRASLEANPKEPQYAWSVRSDVWVDYLGQRGDLTVGFARPNKCFGPEYNFGHVVGDHYDEQVLLIKTAWGGKSLGRDFLAPSAPHPSAEEYARMAAERTAQNKKRAEAKGGEAKVVTAAEIEASYGHFYREMLREVRESLANLKERFPKYRGQGYELTGFVWFQGWNDQFNDDWSGGYETHLAHLIRDVRKDLEAPGMNFVIGQVGFDGQKEPKKSKDGKPSPRDLIKKAQLAMAGYEEFEGTVRVVETDQYWDMEADAIYHGPGGWKADVEKWKQFGNDRPYHYLGSPWFFAQIGTAFGKSMLEML
ncbi:MAG: sialate O-acetylesterase [bacterium]|nr:sialate O-acetylesterase [bacterium]